jgi:hypothetical protein
MKIASFLVGLVAGIVITAFVFAFAIFLDSTQTAVRLHNGSSSSLQHVEIVLAERTIWTGDLPAGESIATEGEPSGDGEVHIRFTRGGQPVSHSFGYVTNGLSGELHMVEIADETGLTQTTCPKPLGQFFMRAGD